MDRRRWILPSPPPADCLKSLRGIPFSTAQIAYNRGVTDLKQLRIFLDADRSLLSDPGLLPDIGLAIPRLWKALKANELIAVYGDFDADGVTATALLQEGLRALGARTTPYIPHRTEEGHGLSLQGLENLRHLGSTLILTADCGVSSIAEVKAAAAMGIDVIVTDHHSPPPQLPPALAVIDPKRPDSRYPYRYLAAVGVAYKLVQLLREALGQEEDESLLDLVALGTVADLAPLTGENRYLVKRGMQVLNSTERPGLRELAAVAGLAFGALDAESVSFGLAPRINAAGRIDHAITSYRLLTATSAAEARPLAEELEVRNRQRQSLTEETVGRVREEVVSRQREQPVLIAGSQGYMPGVVGLAAGKLAEEFYRPAVVIAMGPEVSRASARSIPEFDIISALRQCSDLFLRYGGHAQAAGFVIANGRLEELKQRLLHIADKELAGQDLRPSIRIDVQMPLRDVKGRLIKFLGLLEPTGHGNPRPTFLSRRVQVVDVRQVGADTRHLRLRLRDGPASWTAVGFGLGSRMGEVASYLDVVYQVKSSRWKDREVLEMEVLDFAPSP